MNNSKRWASVTRSYRDAKLILIIILGLALAAALLWLLYLYVFAWHNAPHLAQMVGG